MISIETMPTTTTAMPISEYFRKRRNGCSPPGAGWALKAYSWKDRGILLRS